MPEKKQYRISYLDNNGKIRRYYPDFVRDSHLVEIKGIGWENHPMHKKLTPAKREAAITYCKERGLTYEFVELALIPKTEIFKMRKNGTLTLDRNWERQYQIWEKEINA